MMKNKRSNLKSLFFVIILIGIIPFSIFAGRPKVTNITMSPAAPDFGQPMTVNITFCSNQQPAELAIAISRWPTKVAAGTGGQVFVVSSAGGPTVIFPTDPISIVAYSGSGVGPYNCLDCGNDANSVSTTKQYIFNVPDKDMFSGCGNDKLYLHIGMKDDGGGIYKSEWAGLAACESGSILSWDIPILPASYTIRKRAEGVIRYLNDLMLFSIDYNYANGPLTITDPLPGGGDFTLVAVGPDPIPSGLCTHPALGSATSGTITWQLPDRTGLKGSAQGTVWFTMRVNKADLGTKVPYINIASGNMNGVIKTTPPVSLITDMAAISVEKIAAASSVNIGDNITYYLNYVVNGSQLKVFRAFDDLNVGAYTCPTTIPGWTYLPQSGDCGIWTVKDDCATGDKYIQGSAAANGHYPGLLLDDPTPSNVQFCTGIIEADVMIDPLLFDGADANILLRSNGQAGTNGYSYGLLLSIDTAPANGYLAFQKVAAGTPDWKPTAGFKSFQIVGNKWYRTKTEVTVSGCDYIFSAKVWGRGDPEPGAYQITYTYTGDACAAATRCDGVGATYNDWRPGIGEQRGDSGDTRDSYDNFIVYVPKASANTTLYDTIPTGIINPAGSGAYVFDAGPQRIRWNLGLQSNTSGSYTWWGKVNTCDPITNKAAMDGDDPIIPVFSNEVVISPICMPISGITKTANVVSPAVALVGDIITWYISYRNDGVGTIPNYKVIDDIPIGMNSLGCSTGTGTCTYGGPVIFNIGNLAPGASGNLTWWGRIIAP